MWADTFGRRWLGNMKDSNESMANNNVQEDRSMSPITSDAPPIIEVKRNTSSCQQLHIRVQPISHSCTYPPQSSTKSTTTWLQVFQSSSKKIAHRAWCTRWALALLSGPWFIEWPDELDQGHPWFNQCEPRSMHNDCTRWYTEWIQQVHQNELNPPIQLSLSVNRLNVTYKTIITSHFLQPHKWHESLIHMNFEAGLPRGAFKNWTRWACTRRTRRSCCVNTHSMVMSAIVHRKSHYRHTYTATRNN